MSINEKQPSGSLVSKTTTYFPNEDYSPPPIYSVVGTARDTFFITGDELRTKVVLDHSKTPKIKLTLRASYGSTNVDRTFEIEVKEVTPPSTTLDTLRFPATAREGAVSMVIGDDLYIGLGDSTADFKDFWKYSSITKKWTQIADFPGGERSDAVAFVVNGKGFVGTGYNKTSRTYYKDFYELDPSTDSWKKVADYSGTARRATISFVINGKAYVGTGRDASGGLKDMYAYDPTTDTWTKVADNPLARQGAVAFTINNKGYTSSGATYDGFTDVKSDVQEYDPSTDTWSEKIFADGFDLGFIGARASVFNDLAYLFYGNKDFVSTYNPSDNSVNNLGDIHNLKEEKGNAFGDVRAGGISFVLNNIIYFGLGSHAKEVQGSVFGGTGYSNLIYPYRVTNSVSNKAPTDLFINPKTSLSIFENVSGTTEVGTFIPLDPNAGDSHTYSLVSGQGDTDNSLFSISGSTISITGAADYEKTPKLSIRVQVADDSNNTFEKMFTINVLDVFEGNAPTTLANIIVEADIANKVVGILDTYPKQGKLTYEIYVPENADPNVCNEFTNSFFKVSGDTLLTAKAIPYYEDPGTSYNFYTVGFRAFGEDGKQYGIGRSFVLEVVKSTSKNKVSTEPLYSVYPNPVEDVFHLRIAQQVTGSVSISLYDVVGNLLRSTEIHTTDGHTEYHSVDVSTLPSGTYLVQVQSESSTETYTLIKK